MQIIPLKKEARTFMPEIMAPGTGLSPLTPKSKVPTNNVHTIQDVLDGRKYQVPGGGGDWSDLWGEDVGKSYKDKGVDYKRQERDWEIIEKMLNSPHDGGKEEWRVKIPGGAKTFNSFQSAQRYMMKLKDKGVNANWAARVKQAQTIQKSKVQVVSEGLGKTFMVEAIDFTRGVKENGGAFCVSEHHFVTCAHVIKKYNKNDEKDLAFDDISGNIRLSIIKNGRKYPAQLVAIDGALDLALLHCEISAEPFKISQNYLVGEDILAIGSPHGFENNVSFGKIGSVDRKIYVHKGAPEYMFVDLSVFSGNSGGPIIKMSDGSVIGVITSIVAESGEYGLNAGLQPEYLERFCIMNEVNIEK